MTNIQLRNWRQSLGISQAEAARRLLTIKRTYERWEAGTSRPPEHLDLACAAVAKGLPPWTQGGVMHNTRINFATYGPGAQMLEEQGRMPEFAAPRSDMSAEDAVRCAIERKSGYKATLSYAGYDPSSGREHHQLTLCKGKTPVAEMWVTISQHPPEAADDA